MVTLHVSVWVEISDNHGFCGHTRSRSTWACELKLWWRGIFFALVSSRSTWACELKFLLNFYNSGFTASRSTWACELKYKCSSTQGNFEDVTLHVSVWVEIWIAQNLYHCFASRSTWACELKSKEVILFFWCVSHAPRERVSQFSFQRRTYRYWIIQITAPLRRGGIFIPKYYTFFMCFPSNPPIHTPKFVQTNDL